MGLRRSFWVPFFGLPRGPIGRVGARVLPVVSGPLHAMVARELKLRADDELLDVGCGSGGLLADHASHVRRIVGLDASRIQVDMARRRLARRIGAGTAEIVLGDAMAMPWHDGSFSVIASVNCLKFVPDPPRALREMHRVLRPDGRIVLTIDRQADKWSRSGEVDAFGQWQWNPDNVRRLMEDAGFSEVSVADMPTRLGMQCVRGMKKVVPAAPVAIETPELATAGSGR